MLRPSVGGMGHAGSRVASIASLGNTQQVAPVLTGECDVHKPEVE
jgi:hypothetical protein